jgi:hypothetical protein
MLSACDQAGLGVLDGNLYEFAIFRDLTMRSFLYAEHGIFEAVAVGSAEESG